MKDIVVRVASRALPKNTYKLLKKIKDRDERKTTMEHAILTYLDEKNNILNVKLNFLRSQQAHVLFADNYLTILKDKLQHLRAHFSEQNLIKILEIMYKADKEVRALNV